MPPPQDAGARNQSLGSGCRRRGENQGGGAIVNTASMGGLIPYPEGLVF